MTTLFIKFMMAYCMDESTAHTRQLNTLCTKRQESILVDTHKKLRYGMNSNWHKNEQQRRMEKSEIGCRNWNELIYSPFQINWNGLYLDFRNANWIVYEAASAIAAAVVAPPPTITDLPFVFIITCFDPNEIESGIK